MPKVTLNNISSGYLSTTVLNDNFTKIGEAIEKTLSRDGTMPNQMNTNLDMNGNTINNISDIIIDGVSVADSLVATYTALTEYSSLTTAHGVEGVIVGTTDAQTLSNKTISTGSSWEGNLISEGYGGTGLTSYNSGDTIYANAVDNLTTLPVGEQGQVLTVVDGLPKWSALSGTGLGDVSGPAFATSGNFVSFDGATGKIIKDSGKVTPVGALVGTTDTQTLTNKTINSPSGLVKADVGLSVVDNTSDLNKPISTATQTALDGKASSTHVHTASAVTYAGSTNLVATNVEAALDELDTEKAALAGSASQSFSAYNYALNVYGTVGSLYYDGGWKGRYSSTGSIWGLVGTNDSSGKFSIKMATATTVDGAVSDKDVLNMWPTGAVTIPGTLSLTGASSTLGYGMGAGISATQTTSRTTTLPAMNRPTGQITLVSAAGSASWQTFTVPNTLIGANDCVVLTQLSGTDKYLSHCTKRVAGTSFDITFATTGGTTVEQPVFQFDIIKGAAS